MKNYKLNLGNYESNPVVCKHNAPLRPFFDYLIKLEPFFVGLF